MKNSIVELRAHSLKNLQCTFLRLAGLVVIVLCSLEEAKVSASELDTVKPSDRAAIALIIEGYNLECKDSRLERGLVSGYEDDLLKVVLGSHKSEDVFVAMSRNYSVDCSGFASIPTSINSSRNNDISSTLDETFAFCNTLCA